MFVIFLSVSLTRVCSFGASSSLHHLARPQRCNGLSLSRTAHRSAVSLLAKKSKKGGKAKKGQKQSGFAWASDFKVQPFESSSKRQLAETVASSHLSRAGKPLSDELVGATDLPKALWNAPVACMVMGPEDANESTDAAAGEVCLYANLAALEAHGLGQDFERLIGAGSKLAASMGGDSKFQSGYSKKLVGQEGAFTIVEGSRWKLEQMTVVEGTLKMESVGTAYAWSQWHLEDGTVCRPGGVTEVKEVEETKALSAEEIAEAVAKQASEVRRLKEEEGLSNQDTAVVEAVAKLLHLKLLQQS